MIIDDSESYRAYISGLVERFGFAVMTRRDGAEALETLREPTSYDLLVVDSEMPCLNGLELISAVRSEQRHADVYALMLTAREDVDIKISALRLGFDDFISKSAGELEIAAKLSAVRRLISRQRRVDATVRELYGLATRDELTGLFNRRFFFSEAERLLAEGVVVNLVIFDLDGFKVINDTYGHLAGDRILRDLGAMFLRRTRSEDLIARYGGDEFVMLVPSLGAPEVEALAGRVAAEIASTEWTFGSHTTGIGVTTGIACSSLLEQPTIAQLLSAGDRDLYKNKWILDHPDVDPSLYQYDSNREAHVVDLVQRAAAKRRVLDKE
jgi:two-component system cell cycle response regulator